MDLKDWIQLLALPFVGWLSTAVFTNTKRAQRLKLIGDSFDAISQQLTDTGSGSSSQRRLIAAVRMRRFFDKEGEFAISEVLIKESIKHFSIKIKFVCPYEKDALSVISALLKTPVGKDDPQVQKALADSLAYANDLSGVDLQGADLSNSFLGAKSSAEQMSLRELDFFGATLIKASLKYADCGGAKFVQAEMRECVMDYGDFASADFRGANLTKARLKHANLEEANFQGADLTQANFAEANLSGGVFNGCKLEGAQFKGAKGIPIEIMKRLDTASIYH